MRQLLVLLTLLLAATPVVADQYLYVLKLVPRLHADDAWTEADNAAIGRHFRHLQQAAAAGTVILGGRTQEPATETMGLVIFEAEDAVAARAFMESDPAIAEGLMTATLHPYQVAMQRAAPPVTDHAALVAEVTATEIAFAQSMADRDFTSFQRFIAADAIFMNGGEPLDGKAAIAARWREFFTEPTAPFAWAPEHVIVLANGTLAQTDGSVTGSDGTVIARFHSVWRREPNGGWLIVFDDGYPICR